MTLTEAFKKAEAIIPPDHFFGISLACQRGKNGVVKCIYASSRKAAELDGGIYCRQFKTLEEAVDVITKPYL